MRILAADNHEDGMFKCRGELLERLCGMAQVYISVPDGKYVREMEKMGCVFEDIEIDRRGMNPLNEIKLISQYKKLLKKVKPDVVLTYSIKPNVYLGHLCARKKIPYIANVTGLGSAIRAGGLSAALTRFLYRIGLRKARMVFCQNEENLEYLLKHKVIKGDHDLIPGSGVNLDVHRFEEYPAESQGINFLTVGRIMKEKGTDELLCAAREVKKKYPDVTFSMIGFYDGDYEKIINDAQAEGIVTFFGHQDDVHEFVKKCSAIVHPSYHEGMANAILEGAAAGRPVIASDVSGCREAFVPGETGFACKPRDAKSLEDAIVRFIETPYEKKAAMGAAARRKMENDFSREIVVDKYVNQIRKIGAEK